MKLNHLSLAKTQIDLDRYRSMQMRYMTASYYKFLAWSVAMYITWGENWQSTLKNYERMEAN